MSTSERKRARAHQTGEPNQTGIELEIARLQKHPGLHTRSGGRTDAVHLHFEPSLDA